MESKQIAADCKVEINEYNRWKTKPKRQRTFFRKSVSSFADKFMWKYTCWWEKDNAEEYDEGIFESELPYIAEQRWIKAKEIDMDGWSISESDFPWHGYSLSDFVKLDKKLQSCKAAVKAISCAKDVERFRRKRREVYDAYFLSPMCLIKEENGAVHFLEDGRHRMFAATLNDGEVPVWVIEYKKTSEVSREYFTRRFMCGSWRFLNEL